MRVSAEQEGLRCPFRRCSICGAEKQERRCRPGDGKSWHLSPGPKPGGEQRPKPLLSLAPALPSFPPRPTGSDEGLDALATRTFDNFFRHVHHVPVFSFLHRASLMERYYAGLLDRALLLALIGITSLLTDLGTTQEYGNLCIEEAAQLVLSELEKPSILRLQALVIIVKHRILTRRFSSAFMLHATACRFATALRLNYENPNLGFLPRESRRRLMWSVYMIDASIADGQADLAIWSDAERQIHLRLPCNERNFEFDLPEPTESLRPPPPAEDGTLMPLPDDVGFLALHVRIHWIRSRILQYTMRVISQPLVDDVATMPSRCGEFAAELPSLRVQAAALVSVVREQRSTSNLLPSSLHLHGMTHVLWRQCHLDLYRLFLPGLKEALAERVVGQLPPRSSSWQAARYCYEHAEGAGGHFCASLGLGERSPRDGPRSGGERVPMRAGPGLRGESQSAGARTGRRGSPRHGDGLHEGGQPVRERARLRSYRAGHPDGPRRSHARTRRRQRISLAFLSA